MDHDFSAGWSGVHLVLGDPPTRRLQVGKFLGQIVKQGFDRVVGTSGTIQSIGAVAVAERSPNATLRNRRIN